MPNITMPNGDVVNFPDDMPKQQIKEKIAEKFPNEARALGFKGGLKAFGAGAIDTATIGFGDEATARLKGGDYGQNLEAIRNQQKGFQEQQPISYLAGQVVGGIGSGIGAIKGLGTVGKAVAPHLTKAVTGYAAKGAIPTVGANMGFGGVSGGLYAAGSGEGTTQERLARVPQGGAVGALGGAAGYGAGQVLSGITKSGMGLASRAKNAFLKPNTQMTATIAPMQTIDELASSQTLAPLEKVEQPAISKIKKQLTKDFGDDFNLAMDAYKKGDISLSELHGKRTSFLAKGAGVFSSGRAIASDFFEDKLGGSTDRILKNIRENISGVEAYYATADDLLAAGRAKAAPIYKQAHDANKAVQSPRLDRILSTPTGKDALKSVSDNYQDEMAMMATPDPETTQIAKELASFGMMKETQGGVAKGLSLKSLDAIKKRIDKQISTLKNTVKMGGTAADADKYHALISLNKNLVDELDALDSTGLYKQARAKSGDYLKIQNAIEDGRDALDVDSELLGITFQKLSEPEKQAYRIGLGKAIRDQVNDVSDGRNPYAKILGSPEKRKTIQTILSPEEYLSFQRGLKAEDRLFKLRNEVLAGSDTAQKLEAKNLIENGAVSSLYNVPKKIFEESLLKLKAGFLQGINDKTAAEISAILYETDPIKKLQIIEALSNNKSFNDAEKQLVKNAYAFIAPKFDALMVSPSIAGGMIAVPNSLAVDTKERE